MLSAGWNIQLAGNQWGVLAPFGIFVNGIFIISYFSYQWAQIQLLNIKNWSLFNYIDCYLSQAKATIELHHYRCLQCLAMTEEPVLHIPSPTNCHCLLGLNSDWDHCLTFSFQKLPVTCFSTTMLSCWSLWPGFKPFCGLAWIKLFVFSKKILFLHKYTFKTAGLHCCWYQYQVSGLILRHVLTLTTHFNFTLTLC